MWWKGNEVLPTVEKFPMDFYEGVVFTAEIW